MRPRGVTGYVLFLKAVVAVCAIRACLRYLGFARTLATVGRIAPPPHADAAIARASEHGRPPAPSLNVRDHPMIWAVRAAGRRTIRRNPCLPTALAALVFLRRAGFPAELRIGVDRPGAGVLSAHAWVESNGVVVLGGVSAPIHYRAFPHISVGWRSAPEEPS
jgi:hypothetical protein